MKKIFPFGPSITELEIKTVADVVRDSWHEHPYDYIEKFQKEFANYHGRKYGVMTTNCTSAIHLLLLGLGVKKSDEVIVPEVTWIGSAAPIVYAGAKPIFCDVEKGNWCLDPKSVEKAITKKTKAIIAVNLYGNMPNMTALAKIAKKHKIHLIEDSAESLGSTYKGKKAGSFGIGSVFSFHRSKTITTGEGGMLLLDDKELYERCMMLRDHGRRPGGIAYFSILEITPKYIPSNIQAALGYAQLQRIEDLIAKKIWLLNQYRKGLKNIPDIQMNIEPPQGRNGAWLTGLVVGKSYRLDKIETMKRIEGFGVPMRPFFYPLSSLPAFNQEKEYRKKNPIAYDICARGINLPCDLDLDKEQVDFICDAIKKSLVKKI